MVGINNNIGRTLKRIRERKNLNKQEIVRELKKRFRIHFSASSFSRMESGQSIAKATIVAALCLIYDVNLQSILLTGYEYDYNPSQEVDF